LIDGRNVETLPFVERRQILSNVIMSNDRIRISDFIEEKGIEAFEKIKDFNLEGMMAKRISRLAKDKEYKNSGLCSDRIYKAKQLLLLVLPR
jgi:ATP-dependent DNA ligase